MYYIKNIDYDYLSLAKFWSQKRSKDPSTKVGAVLVSKCGTREYLGYNGFARGVMESEERLNNRELKYPRMVHAEINAILKAGNDTIGATIYTYPLFPCSNCANVIIQSGVKRIISPEPNKGTNWSDSMELAWELFREAGVDCIW